LVVRFPAPTQTDGDLGEATSKVDIEGHQGHPLLINLPHQAPELRALEKELSATHGIFIPDTGRSIRAHMCSMQPELTTIDPGEGLPQLDLPRSDRLDLRALEYDSRLKGLKNLIVVPGLAVAGNDMLTALFTHGRDDEYRPGMSPPVRRCSEDYHGCAHIDHVE